MAIYKRPYATAKRRYRRVKRSYAKRKRAATTITRAYKKYKRRGGGTKRRRTSGLVLYNRLLQHKIRTALVYADTKTLGQGTGQTHHTFSLNSIADPDVDGGGHQPAFHDKWATLYTNYRVIRTSFAITFAPLRGYHAVNVLAGGTASGESLPVVDGSHNDQLFLPGLVGFEVNDQNGIQQWEAQDKNIIREVGWKKNCQWKYTSTDPNRTYTFTSSFSPREYLDDPEAANLASTFGSNPNASNTGYLHVCKMSKDGNTMSAYRFDIRLTFVVELTDPIGVENEN